MKPRVTTFLLAILVMLFSACGGGESLTDEPPITPCPAIYENETLAIEPAIIAPEPTPDSLMDIFPSGLTRAEYLEDLDYLYETLKANFALFNALYRARGVDLHKRFYTARNILETAPPGIPFTNTILRNIIFEPAGGFGHLAILNANNVRFRLALFSRSHDENSNPYSPFIDVMDNPASRAFYSLTDADFEPQGEQQQTILEHHDGNIETEILEEGRIGYVRIHQMSASSMEGDYLQLIEFYERISDFQHLIIDIRGNGGGSSAFFPDLVIAPNINETMYYNQYLFFMAGAHNMRFLEPLINVGWMSYMQIGPVHSGLFENLPYFHPQDIGLMDYYMQHTGQIHPSRDEAIFDGKVWLLIDRANFSASGIAAEIAKETGFATLVGRPTTSSGMGINPTIIALPNSGVIVQYQTLYSTNFQGRNGYEYGTQPHVSNFAGMDALETTLNLIEQWEQ